MAQEAPPREEGQTLVALERLGQYLRTETQREGTGVGLSPTQIAILRRVDAAGACGATALASTLGISQPTVTDAVRALERKGLVVRRSDPRDRRTAPVDLTAEGTAVLAGLTAMPAALDQALTTLDVDDRAALRRALSKLIRGLQEVGAISVQRMCLTCLHFRPNAHPGAVEPHHCQFVDAAFGDGALRVDCGDHEPADASARAALAAGTAAPAG